MSAPLPVDPAGSLDDQRYQALTYADQRGWIRFDHVSPGRLSQRRWVISVLGGRTPGRRRDLHPDWVLPYVAGLADAHGAGHLFPDPAYLPDPVPRHAGGGDTLVDPLATDDQSD